MEYVATRHCQAIGPETSRSVVYADLKRLAGLSPGKRRILPDDRTKQQIIAMRQAHYDNHADRASVSLACVILHVHTPTRRTGRTSCRRLSTQMNCRQATGRLSGCTMRRYRPVGVELPADIADRSLGVSPWLLLRIGGRIDAKDLHQGDPQPPSRRHKATAGRHSNNGAH